MAAVLFTYTIVSYACTEYIHMENGCAQICLGNMVSFCPVSVVQSFGGLQKGRCANAGFVHDTGTTHTVSAGPCGKLTFQVYARITTLEPTETLTISIFSANYNRSKCPDDNRDCCGSPTSGESQSCKDGYLARPIAPEECSNKSCAAFAGGLACYGCYPPTNGGTYKKGFCILLSKDLPRTHTHAHT